MKDIFESFMEEIRAEVKKLCGENYIVKTMEMLKNNGMIMDGLSISEKWSTTAVIMYMEGYFGRYQKGEKIKELAHEIYQEYMEQKATDKIDVRISTWKDFGSIRENIVCRLVNAGMNAAHLSNVPYIPVTDLAVVFYIYIGDCRHGQLFSAVTNRHTKIWGVSAEELYAQALQNTPRLFPAKLNSMEEVIANLLDEEYPPETLSEFSEGNMPPLYVLSNRYAKNGAAALLYPNMLKQAAEKLKSDLLILPSSIHEVILIPYKNENIDHLEDMVKNVNKDNVPLHERLSDHVYLYRRHCNQLSKASDGREASEWFSLSQ